MLQPRTSLFIWPLALACALLMILTPACGGGSSRTISRELPPVVVTIAPATATGMAGTGIGLTATVSNASDQTVSWSIQEGASAGSIVAGMFTPAAAGTFHIVATSLADPTKSAMATITVMAPAPTFTTTAPAAADEGQPYSYTIAVNDPAKSALTFTLVEKPDGATISGNTVAWTPSASQARAASTFSVEVKTKAGGSATQSWTVTPTGIIHGLALWTYATESGDISDVPDDISGDTFQIHVPNAGGFTTLAGAGNANGEMTAPGVPAGYFWLQSGASYLWTNRSAIDLGGVVPGRQSLKAASANTTLTTALSGVSPLQGFDHFQVFAPGAGVLRDQALTSYTLFDTAASPVFNWSTFNLPDSAGDHAYITQLTTLNVGKHFHLLQKFADVPIQVLDGAANTLGATLTDAPNAFSVAATFNGSQWTSLAPAVSPTAKASNTNAYVGVQAYGNSHGSLTWPTPRLASYYGADGPLGDESYGPFPVFNPYPSQWPLLVDYDQTFEVPYTLPGVASKMWLINHIRSVTTGMPTDAGFAHPLVTPVQSPAINGNDFFTPQSNVGLNPVLSWTAPPNATGYVIMVLRVYDNAGQINVEGVATLRTTTTSIPIPPGVLVAGNSYAFVVQAHSEPGIDYSFSPYRHSLPHGMASAASALITP